MANMSPNMAPKTDIATAHHKIPLTANSITTHIISYFSINRVQCQESNLKQKQILIWLTLKN